MRSGLLFKSRVRETPINLETGSGSGATAESDRPASTPVATSGPTVRFEDVSLVFRGRTSGREVSALSNVSFEVADKEFCAIIGPSGCGKSTLLNLAAGLRPPTAGDVYVQSERVRALVPSIGYVTQDSNLLPWMTVKENIRLPLEIRKVPKAVQQERVGHWMDLVGLTGFETSYPRQLSGGMQQRCSIARTLVYDPPVLLMDEPFGSVDAITRVVLQDTLLKLWSEQQKTVLFVTHDLSEALALADKVIIMTRRPGRVKAVVPVSIPRPRDVFHVAEHPEFANQHRTLWDMFNSEIA